MSESQEDCCAPGDITVTQVYSGWMIGHVLEQIGPGPWWSFIAIVSEFQTALHQARVLARQENVRAWFHEGAASYRPIPMDDSPYSVPRGDR